MSEEAAVADKASEAWKRQVDAELVAAELRSIGKDFISLLQGFPLERHGNACWAVSR